MEFILREIEKALDCGLYYLALQSTLTLPDICGALQSDNGRATGEKYKNWYKNCADFSDPNTLSAEDCYSFRCSCLHQGSTLHEDSSYKRILFLVPNNVITLVGYSVINDALHINIETFCRNMISAVRRWESSAKTTPNFIKNYEKVIKLHPLGIAPYIVGLPVIT